MTKSSEEKTGYGYGSYRYGAIDKSRTEIVMLGHKGRQLGLRGRGA